MFSGSKLAPLVRFPPLRFAWRCSSDGWSGGFINRTPKRSNYPSCKQKPLVRFPINSGPVARNAVFSRVARRRYWRTFRQRAARPSKPLFRYSVRIVRIVRSIGVMSDGEVGGRSQRATRRRPQRRAQPSREVAAHSFLGFRHQNSTLLRRRTQRHRPAGFGKAIPPAASVDAARSVPCAAACAMEGARGARPAAY